MRLLQILKELLLLSIQTKIWNRGQFASASNAIFIRMSFERLGSVFIKLGQLLALRPDVIPAVFCTEFYRLLDHVPPFDSEEALRIAKSELGKNFSKIQSIDPVPLASASFAQVHKGILTTGEVIVVKIQRPEIPDLVQKDLSIVRFLAKTIDILFRPTNRMQDIVIQFEDWTHEELDYTLEFKNIVTFNQLSKWVGDGIRGPRVYADLVSSKVLVMEYIHGSTLMHLLDIKKRSPKDTKRNKLNGKLIMKKLIRNILEMSHVYGFFHADPHPANIIFTPSKELVFIDFGIVGQLSQEERILILRYLRTLLSGNSEESFRTIMRLCRREDMIFNTKLIDSYQALVSKFTNTFDSKTYLEQQIKSGPVFVDTLKLLQSHGIVAPMSIVRYFKTFETVEGLIFALYPTLQIQDMAKEFRRVTLVNIVDSLPNIVTKANFDKMVTSLIDSLEKGLLINS